MAEERSRGSILESMGGDGGGFRPKSGDDSSRGRDGKAKWLLVFGLLGRVGLALGFYFSMGLRLSSFATGLGFGPVQRALAWRALLVVGSFALSKRTRGRAEAGAEGRGQWQELQLLPPLPLMEASLLVAPKPSMPRTFSSIFSARGSARRWRWRCLAVAATATTKVTLVPASSIHAQHFFLMMILRMYQQHPVLVMCKTASRHPLGKKPCQCPGAAPSGTQAANDSGSSRRRPARRRRRHGSATMSSFISPRGGGIGTVAGHHQPEPVPRGGGAGRPAGPGDGQGGGGRDGASSVGVRLPLHPADRHVVVPEAPRDGVPLRGGVRAHGAVPRRHAQAHPAARRRRRHARRLVRTRQLPQRDPRRPTGPARPALAAAGAGLGLATTAFYFASLIPFHSSCRSL